MNPSDNNSFGEQGGQIRQSIISSGGGDVALPVAKSGTNKRKKKLLVVSVLLLAVSITCMTILTLRPFGGTNSSSDIESVNDRVVNNYLNYAFIGDEMISAYDVGGIEGAKEYYDKNIVCDADGVEETLKQICGLEMDYFEAYLNEYIGYKDVGCIVNGSYDIQCAIERYGAKSFAERFENSMSVDSLLYDLVNEQNDSIIEKARMEKVGMKGEVAIYV
ncbi:hypothetical protein IJJ37_00835 [Candidatus Saccharibacteria bacterium]|nr:hypothetical protein [Candidatus Saccharibacteria bacterium]